MEHLACEFFVLRYIPDLIRGEFVNIGVILRTVESGASLVRITRDWTRVQRLAPGADTDLLEGMEAFFAASLNSCGSGSEPAMDALRESLSTSVQMSEPRGVLVHSMDAGMDMLMRFHVDAVRHQD